MAGPKDMNPSHEAPSCRTDPEGRAPIRRDGRRPGLTPRGLDRHGGSAGLVSIDATDDVSLL